MSRVAAIEWWNGKSITDKIKLANKSLKEFKNTDRNPNTLTGREIEIIYKKHSNV